MFHRELKINYGMLGDLISNIESYQSALSVMKQSVEKIWELLEESSGEAYEGLEERKETILGQISSCEGELTDLHDLLAGYSYDMQSVIAPVDGEQTMVVDRNDIWFNMQSILSACDRIAAMVYNVNVPWLGTTYTAFAKDKTISAEDNAFLEETAKKYDVFTRMKDDSRIRILLKQLLTKVDVVPPSLMISTAAIYTDWGMSRLALKANALYRDEIWYEDKGLKPQDDPNAQYHYEEFNSLEDCIRQRALKLNSHINYDYFRESRRVARALRKPPYGPQLAATMIDDSNLKNVAGLIDYTFTFFQLANTDYFSQLKDVE